MSRTTSRRRTGALAVAVSLAASLLVAGDAVASKIVYSCGDELCAVDPDTGVSARITTDGGTSAYRYPSVSRDGRRVAAARGDDVMAGDYGTNLTQRLAGSRSLNDVAISPSGADVAESHSYVENRYGCPLTGGCLELVDMSATGYAGAGVPDGREWRFPGGGGVGFLGERALLSSYFTLRERSHVICVVADPTVRGSPCEPRVASTTTLSTPDGSPDGALIAVTVSEPDPAGATVRLFDAVSGAEVRSLGPGANPSFSPDGRHVAFTGTDSWIHVVPTAGGRARRVIQGVSPSWGDGAGPGPALASRSLRLRRAGIPVAVACGGPAPCRGTVRLAKGRTVVGTRAYRVAAGRRAVVAVRPTRRGQAAIARSGRHAVTVQLTPQGGRALSTRLTLRR